MSDTMKAVVLTGPGEYSVQRVPVPEPGPMEVLVRIRAVAICGTDPKLFAGAFAGMWPPAYPFIAGHEFAGEVAALGAGVTGLAVGDRVAGEAHCGCGHCRACMAGFYNLCENYGHPETGHRHYGFIVQGAYAEYNVYSVKAVTKMPDNVSFDEGSMCDTAGTSFNGIRLIGVTPGGFSAFIGPGPVGLSAMLMAKSMGSTVIMVGRGARLEAAKRLSADFVVDFEKENMYARIEEITGGRKADEVFECAGNEASVNQALGSVKRGGSVALLGLPTSNSMNVNMKSVIMDQIRVQGCRANPNCSEQVLRMMSTGGLNVKDMVTHTFAIDDIHEAMDTFVHRRDGALKVVIHP